LLIDIILSHEPGRLSFKESDDEIGRATGYESRVGAHLGLSLYPRPAGPHRSRSSRRGYGTWFALDSVIAVETKQTNPERDPFSPEVVHARHFQYPSQQ
jgi:hypothetical protein